LTDLRAIDDGVGRLPGQAGEIAEAIGRERALFLLAHLRVSRKRDMRRDQPSERYILYVPKRMPVDHWLVHLLGWHDAERLRRAFGGEILHPPKCNILMLRWRRRRIGELSAEGLSTAEIAREVGLSDRQVRNIRAE